MQLWAPAFAGETQAGVPPHFAPSSSPRHCRFFLSFVIAGLVPAIHSAGASTRCALTAWMPGTSPGMTKVEDAGMTKTLAGPKPTSPKPFSHGSQDNPTKWAPESEGGMARRKAQVLMARGRKDRAGTSRRANRSVHTAPGPASLIPHYAYDREPERNRAQGGP